jgi:hypothetical protein
VVIVVIVTPCRFYTFLLQEVIRTTNGYFSYVIVQSSAMTTSSHMRLPLVIGLDEHAKRRR